MRLLLVDNYDSFTWNLAHYFAELGCAVDVRTPDELPPSLRVYHAVVLSPGPGRPEQARGSLEIAASALGRVPILGVCLGHQVLARLCGGRVERTALRAHGKVASIRHDGSGLFREIPSPFSATLYHSLAVDPEEPGRNLSISAVSEEGVPMALAHRRHPAFGVQFHPESVATEHGHRLLANFLSETVRWYGRDVA